MHGLWILQGYTRFCVNCILKIHGILNVLSSEYAKVLNVSGIKMYYSYKEFWIKYFIAYIPGFINKTLHHRWLTGFWICHVYTRLLKKCSTIDNWQNSKYSSSSEDVRVLNMPGLYKVLNKTLHYKYLVGFWICL